MMIEDWISDIISGSVENLKYTVPESTLLIPVQNGAIIMSFVPRGKGCGVGEVNEFRIERTPFELTWVGLCIIKTS